MGAKKAFTLVELAIVLVIIGLLVGGVLVGQNLIESAAIRTQTKQFADINAGANTFRLKYKALPADISQTHSNQYGISPASLGWPQRAENGYVDGYWSNNLETWDFFPQLAGAGMITCVGCGPVWDFFTSSQFDAMFNASKIAPRGILHVYGGASPDNYAGVSIGSYGNNFIEICEARATGGGLPLTPQQAYGLDSKMDDGWPLTGVMTATNACTADNWEDYWRANRAPTSGAAGDPTCVSTDTTPNPYNVTSAMPACNLRLKASF